MSEQHGQQTEFSIKSTGPSGWETPENVQHIVDKALEGVNSIQATNQAAIQAANVMQRRVIGVAALICSGCIAAVLLDVYAGNTSLAERVLIPLISFAGGIGLGSVRPRQ